MRSLLLYLCHQTPRPRFSALQIELQLPLCSLSQGQAFFSTSNRGRKGKAAPLQERRMIDRVRVWAKGGDGGNGCWSIRRSRSDWRGKPDGGNGGRGGDVVLECSSAVWDFSNLQHHLNAKRGGHGASKKKIGSRGSDKVMQVPVGTVIHLVSGEVPLYATKAASTPLQPWEMDTTVDEHPLTSRELIDGMEKLMVGIRERECEGNSYPPSENCDVVSQSPRSCSPKSLLTELDDGCPNEIDETEIDNNMSSEDLSDAEPHREVVQYAVAELTEPNQRVVIARGGEGGLGNAYIGKVPDPHNKAKHKENTGNPEIVADGNLDDAQNSLTAGFPGTESILILELKSIADVGLVGMPNVGKSTLLGAISRAKPAVGDYAFTTLRPNIGKLNYKDFFSVSVADIPGIIKGAHENRGLGHAFLRHIERTKVLAYVVDLASTLDGRKGILPWEQLRDLLLELEHYQRDLTNRPSLVVANKIDENGAEDIYEELKRRVQGVPIFPVCAILEEGIPELKAGLRSIMDGKESHCLKLDNIAADVPSEEYSSI